MEFETLCLHADNNRKDEWGCIATPICQSAMERFRCALKGENV